MHEQTDSLTFLQVENTKRRVQHFLLGDLEQLIARVSVQDIEQGLFGVAVLRISRALNDVSHFLAQQWNHTRVAIVGRRRVEPGKAMFANHLALLVEDLDADVIQIARPVHGRTVIAFGHDQQTRLRRRLVALQRQ